MFELPQQFTVIKLAAWKPILTSLSMCAESHRRTGRTAVCNTVIVATAAFDRSLWTVWRLLNRNLNSVWCNRIPWESQVETVWDQIVRYWFNSLIWEQLVRLSAILFVWVFFSCHNVKTFNLKVTCYGADKKWQPVTGYLLLFRL